MYFNIILIMILVWMLTIVIFLEFEKNILIKENIINLFKSFNWWQWCPIVNTVILLTTAIMWLFFYVLGIIFKIIGFFFKN